MITKKPKPVSGDYRPVFRLLLTSLFFLSLQVCSFGAISPTPHFIKHENIPVISAEPTSGCLNPTNPIVTQDQWIFDKTVGNVDFYHRLADCSGQKVVFLKLNNKNSNAVHVSWKEVFATQMQAETEGFSGKKQLTLKPGESFVKDCSDSRLKELLILPTQVNPTYVVEIKQFGFKDIAVNKAM